MSANLEYAAHNHGEGQGWSWDVAKASRGKMTDMIEAQRQAWDLEVADLGARSAPDRSMATFSIPAGRRARAMCKAQSDRQWQVQNEMVPRPVDVVDTASLVQRMIGRWIAGSLRGSGRVLRTIGPQDYLEYGRTLCGQLMGQVLEMSDSDVDGMPLWIKYWFADGSEVSIWAE